MPVTARSVPRRAFLLCGVAGALPAGVREEVLDTIAIVAAALTDGNSARAAEPFDKNMPEYETLRGYFATLAERFDTASSVDLLELEEKNGAVEVKLRWLLRITAMGSAMRLKDREEEVSARFERRGKKWKILRFAPVDFFRPPPGD